MVEVFRYSAGEEFYDLPISQYEAHLLLSSSFAAIDQREALLRAREDRDTPVERELILKIARQHTAKFRADAELLAYEYAIRMHRVAAEPADAAKALFGVTLSGFRIGGRVHGIWAGPGQCELREIGSGADGRMQVTRSADIRLWNVVDTDGGGRIDIVRSRRDVPLARHLNELEQFLSRRKDQFIVKTCRREPGET